MNKRGITSQQYIWTFYIILGAVIFVLLVNYIRMEITGESHAQHILSKKLGLTFDATYASNGELDLNYNLSNTFFINSENGFLTVKKEKLGSWGSYSVAQNKNNLNFNLETDKLNIKSIKGDISVNG